MVSRMFRMETGVDKERHRLLRARLRAANAEASAALREMRGTPLEQEEPLGVWVIGDAGELVGGLTGHTWGRWLHVGLLWVAEEFRGAGVGGRLLAEAERVAVERGCRNSRLETWDFQAPAFYRQQGYDVVCVIPDYPEGHKEFTLTKRLG
ncbi:MULTISPECIES: GNAT family N-acetyltransferase [Streptomyces]|uniref:Biotin transporter BioY n=2 Tax=Streptomyces TaxID=1883 RepID=A0A0W7XAS5_9ACTN|nr:MULTISPECIES: GNAT family N-acetyltransferase [Streptomyces]KUF19905.1 biotin transporter BioY [Streptomyces silvensis]MVO85955.1 GNAT family N-acetyltransferase [Streptomyces typhae]